MSQATGIGGFAATSTSARPTGFNSLSSADFVKIMTTELSRQDPLSPTDSKAILEQISSIRAIESNISLKASLEEMVKQNEFSSASGLIGRKVVALGDDAQELKGVVAGVSSSREGARIVLTNGFTAFVKNVVQVAENKPEAGTAR